MKILEKYAFPIALCLLFLVMFYAGDALAQIDTCTAHPNMTANNSAGGGVVSAVMQTIVGLLQKTSETMYNEIINDAGFQGARNALLMLSLAIYGVMVVFNIVNFRPGEVLGIVFKIGLIVMLTSGGAWQFFNEHIGDFFFGTMLELIEIFTGTAANNATTGYVGQADLAQRVTAPLAIFNWPMARLISTQFFITILGVAALPPYGPILAFLMVMAGFYLIMTLVGALFTYIKSIVGLWFLFALAPIFFLFLLFRRTQSLFEGWINMVVSFTLQPILLFAFLSFFVIITTTSLGELMKVNWCWATMDGATTGSSDEFWFWRPINVYDYNTGQYVKMEGGLWTLAGNLRKDGTPSGIVFPLDTIDVMFFLLSSYVASQYSNFVTTLSQELSSSGLRISVNAEAARNFFASRGWAPEQIAAKGIKSGGSWF